MGWLKTIFGEVFGLFVDDGVLALLIVLWLAALKIVALRSPSMARWGGVLLFCGLAAILAESSLRYARRGKK